MLSFLCMITFKRRLLIYSSLWLFAAFGFAFAPFPTNGYPELQERIGAFFTSPLMVPLGLSCLFSPSSGVLYISFSVYLVAHAVLVLTREQRRSFLWLCALHLFQISVAVVGFILANWQEVGS